MGPSRPIPKRAAEHDVSLRRSGPISDGSFALGVSRGIERVYMQLMYRAFLNVRNLSSGWVAEKSI